MKNERKQIVLDDLSPKLYRAQLEYKNHRICRVLRTLMLRDDFTAFLREIETTCLKLDTVTISNGKTRKVTGIDFSLATKKVNEYLVMVQQSKYCKE